MFHFFKTYLHLTQTDAIDFGLYPFIIPLILHKNIKSAIPKERVHGSIKDWIEKNKKQLPYLSRQIIEAKDHSKDGLMFLLQQNILSITDDGKIKIIQDIELEDAISEEMQDAIKLSSSIAKLFANLPSQNIQDIYRLFGVKP